MRTLVVLAVVLLILVSLWVMQRVQRSHIVVSEPVATLKVDPDRVTKLKVVQPNGDAVVIERIAGAWRMTSPLEYRAEDAVVTGTLRQLESLKLEDVVSTNPEKRGTFQVDSTGTDVLVMAGDDTVLALIVGKTTPDFSHTYVRREGKDAVYRADGILTYNFKKPVDDWRDKSILDLTPESISRLTLDYPKEKIHIVVARADSTWTLTEGNGAAEGTDSTAVVQLVRAAAKLSAGSFAKPEEIAGLDMKSPDFRLRVESDLGTETVDFVEGQDENKIYAQREGHDTIFQLFRTSVLNVMKKAEDLRPKQT